MAKGGGWAPAGLPQRQARTLYLRVPAMDWPRVRLGEKTEFRTKPREGSRLLTCNTPTPVVAYATANGPLKEMAHRLMVLEERRFEALFDIHDDAEALAREGMPSYDHFRGYWRARHGHFDPAQKVYVWRVRAWEEGDLVRQGFNLLKSLYGDWL